MMLAQPGWARAPAAAAAAAAVGAPPSRGGYRWASLAPARQASREGGSDGELGPGGGARAAVRVRAMQFVAQLALAQHSPAAAAGSGRAPGVLSASMAPARRRQRGGGSRSQPTPGPTPAQEPRRVACRVASGPVPPPSAAGGAAFDAHQQLLLELSTRASFQELRTFLDRREQVGGAPVTAAGVRRRGRARAAGRAAALLRSHPWRARRWQPAAARRAPPPPRPAPHPPQELSGAMCVYPLLQAANLRSTIDLGALPPGMDGMSVLMEVRHRLRPARPPARLGCWLGCWLAGRLLPAAWLTRGVHACVRALSSLLGGPGPRVGGAASPLGCSLRPAALMMCLARGPGLLAVAASHARLPLLRPAATCRRRPCLSASAPASRATCWSCRWTHR
jgi:hypothetical protein